MHHSHDIASTIITAYAACLATHNSYGTSTFQNSYIITAFLSLLTQATAAHTTRYPSSSSTIVT